MADLNRAAEQAEMFANRLAKNLKHRRRWAKRGDTTAFRLYDRDIPEVPVTVDLYGQQVLVADARLEDEDAGDEDDAWLVAIVDATVAVVGVAPGDVHVRFRRPQRGTAQYEKIGEGARRIPVQEGGLTFLVDLDAYLDTGLFLDHRNLRARVRREAAGKHVLNLFAYTGSFSVYAAAGGAAHVTTVDMSATYLAWFEENLHANGLDHTKHTIIRGEAFEVLRDLAADAQLFDLMIVDPPTFSNSKRMRGTFDVQRDHAALIRCALDLAAPGGTLYFSTNRRKFQLDASLAAPAPDDVRVEEITETTVPDDFAHRRPHRAWRIVAPLGAAIQRL